MTRMMDARDLRSLLATAGVVAVSLVLRLCLGSHSYSGMCHLCHHIEAQ